MLSADSLVASAIQLVLAIGGSAVVVQLLTLRQTRRKVAGDATVSEANAASTLSGAALKMVEAAQRSAHDTHQELEEERRRSNALRRDIDAVRSRENKLREDLDDALWRVNALERRERDLEDLLRKAGIPVPPRRREYDQRPPGDNVQIMPDEDPDEDMEASGHWQ